MFQIPTFIQPHKAGVEILWEQQELYWVHDYRALILIAKSTYCPSWVKSVAISFLGSDWCTQARWLWRPRPIRIIFFIQTTWQKANFSCRTPSSKSLFGFGLHQSINKCRSKSLRETRKKYAFESFTCENIFLKLILFLRKKNETS